MVKLKSEKASIQISNAPPALKISKLQGPQDFRVAFGTGNRIEVTALIRSDQIGLSLSSPPRHRRVVWVLCTRGPTQEVSDNPAGSREPGGTGGLEVGMGIVHTFLTQEVSDNPAGVVSELSSRRDRGIGSG